MPVRNGDAVWHGTLQDGNGRFSVGSGAFEGAYSFGTRFEDEPGTNPEELIAAAHAACYSMALAGRLAREGFPPRTVRTTAKVRLEKREQGWEVTGITLATTAEVPGIDDASFTTFAAETKSACPVSKALAAVPIELDATLRSAAA